MDAVTYPDPDVQAELARWAFSRVDLAADPAAAQALRVSGIPAVIALDAEGREAGRVEGFVPPAEFAARLARIREGR